LGDLLAGLKEKRNWPRELSHMAAADRRYADLGKQAARSMDLNGKPVDKSFATSIVVYGKDLKAAYRPLSQFPVFHVKGAAP
jgi:hypothetical protein